MPSIRGLVQWSIFLVERKSNPAGVIYDRLPGGRGDAYTDALAVLQLLDRAACRKTRDLLLAYFVDELPLAAFRSSEQQRITAVVAKLNRLLEENGFVQAGAFPQ